MEIPQMPLLEVKDIWKEFPGVKALKGVSMEIRPGEIHALLGENGAGKSTLVKIITGVYQFDSGSLYLDGQEVRPANPQEAQQLGISVIHQELSIIPNLTVAQNIFINYEPVKKSFWGKLGVLDYSRLLNDSETVAKTVGLSSSFLNLQAGTLSIGERQIVEIARALSRDARLIVMDEPTTALSGIDVKRVFSVIADLKKQGKSILYISHDLDEIAEIADRATVIRDGKYIGTVQVRDAQTSDIVKMIVGRELKTGYPGISNPINDEVLRVDSLTGSNKSFQDVSFRITKGEILGITGLLGCGATEVAKVLFGVKNFESGKIYMKGRQIQPKSPTQAVSLGIGYITNDRLREGIVPLVSVCGNIGLASLGVLSRYGIINEKKLKNSAAYYISKMNIRTPSLFTQVKNLSGGNQQKVVLAKWLLRNVDVLIFDEPTKGIDVGARLEIYNLIVKIAKDDGISVIIISTDINEVLAMSHRLLVMRKGKIVLEAPSSSVTKARILEHVVGG